MALRPQLELFRRLRLVPASKDRPVSVPYQTYVELVQIAVERIVDSEWYLQRYPDVAAAIKQGTFQSAAHHYAASGMLEGRMPCPVQINEVDYLARHKDVAKAVKAGALKNATEHFYLSGFVEGRLFQPAEE